MKTIRLKPGKERSLQRGHPWIFDGAIARGGADAGETVRVESHEGVFLAWAAFSPASKIRARVWSFDEKQRIDAAFLAALIANSVNARMRFSIKSSGVRLVHAESDGLPGLIVDRYGDTLVAQFSSCGVERWKSVLCDALLQATGCPRLYERSDTSARALEALREASGWLRGGALPSDGQGEHMGEIILQEHSWQLGLNFVTGHKTGFYLDQRDSRQLFADTVARLAFKQVLNCFCYTGGFTVAALCGMRQAGVLAAVSGASQAGHVTSIDSSGPALAQARANVALNGFSETNATFLDADVNASLRRFIEHGQRFDAIVLDPPKFAANAAQVERAARAYKDLNRLALLLLVPGGVLFTYSCSGAISADLFHKIVASAGADAGVDGFIVQRLGSAPDHPMTLNFPEGEYLKGLVVMKKKHQPET